MVATIQVETDSEGLKQAIAWLFEEQLVLHRLESLRLKNPAQYALAVAEQIPEREISNGYFRRAGYLLDLSMSLELGLKFDAQSVSRADVIGLQALRTAKAEFENEHPRCGACGERQDNRHQACCFSCFQQFRKPGRAA